MRARTSGDVRALLSSQL